MNNINILITHSALTRTSNDYYKQYTSTAIQNHYRSQVSCNEQEEEEEQENVKSVWGVQK